MIIFEPLIALLLVRYLRATLKKNNPDSHFQPLTFAFYSIIVFGRWAQSTGRVGAGFGSWLIWESLMLKRLILDRNGTMPVAVVIVSTLKISRVYSTGCI
jgi:hypothetical protein